MENDNKVQEFVKKYYGKILKSSSDLKTTACCTTDAPPLYLRQALKNVPTEIQERYYGCGSPLPAEIEGLTVVDLGSGSGRDCYVSAALTGPTGQVIGVDMTDEQLEVAREHVESYCRDLGYPESNLQFRHGYIEFLNEAGIANNSVDLVISNCVVNLSPDKERVMSGVVDILKEGGEFYFSDVYCDRRLPEEVRQHELLYGECIAGALYTEDFIRLAHKAGFADPRVLSQSPIEITDAELKPIVGEAKFSSITYRLFKLPSLETLCEDYGQVATYTGGISGQESGFLFDDHHYFIKNKPYLVCGNTASMLEETRLGKYFTIDGKRDTHFGLFDCASPETATLTPPGGACC